MARRSSGRTNAVAPWLAFAASRVVDRPSATAEPPAGEAPATDLARLRLDALVGVALARAGDARAAPLAASVASVTATNLVRERCFRGVSPALSNAGVPHVVLKGWGVRARSAVHARVRPTGDMDLLVAPEAIGATRDVLAAMGFVGRPTPWWEAEETWQRLVQGLPATVDLHRGLHNWPRGSRLVRWILAERERVDGQWVAHPAGQLLASALHRMRHGFPVDGRELLDARVLVAVLPADGVGPLLEAAARTDLEAALLAYLRQARRLFAGLPAPGDDLIAALETEVGAARRHLVGWLAPEAVLDAAPPLEGRPRAGLYAPDLLLGRQRGAVMAALVAHGAARGADALRGLRPG